MSNISAPPAHELEAHRLDEHRLDEHRAVARRLNDLLSAHQQTFPPGRQLYAPEPTPEPFDALLAAAEKQELLGLGVLDIAGRRAARLRARATAEATARDLHARALSDRAARQAQLDDRWAALHGNAPDVVVPAVDARFGDSGRAARATGVRDGVVEITLILDSIDAVPATRPAVSPHGRPTVHPATTDERAEWYRHHVATQMLLAAKEAFAAGPGLTASHVVASYDGRPLVVGQLDRAAFDRISWSLFPWDALVAIDPALLFRFRGQTRELQPVELEPNP
jgi:hypothetical protein